MQGSGKGTLGKAVAARYNLQIFETGGELRKLSSQDTDLAKKVKSIIEAGKLVPNDVVMEIVENFLKTLPENVSVLFDGIPRKVEQAESLNALLNQNGRSYMGVLLDITEETALKRLSTRRICEICKTVYPESYKKEQCECGGKLITRTDDNPEAIKTRLQAFREETIPAMKLYEDKLIKINGEPDIKEVEVLAFEQLDPIMKP